jgi:hypothetical protein
MVKGECEVQRKGGGVKGGGWRPHVQA